MENSKAIGIAIKALENLKGKDIAVIDVHSKTDVFDAMIVVTGTSGRHIESLTDKLEMDAKQEGLDVFGVERDRAWTLVDLYDVVVHIMLEETRDFYSLEKLWRAVGNCEQAL